MEEKIKQLFMEFVRQEKGNKVTDFNMGGLLSSVVFLIGQEQPEDQEKKKEDKLK